jgi:hypothetical protein
MAVLFQTPPALRSLSLPRSRRGTEALSVPSPIRLNLPGVINVLALSNRHTHGGRDAAKISNQPEEGADAGGGDARAMPWSGG